MGFRSTLVSEHYPGVLPNWFTEKYSDRLLFPNGILIVSKTEWKYYDNDVFEDYKEALIEIGFFSIIEFGVAIAVLAEDQFISKVLINKDKITYIWMDEGVEMQHVWKQ
jgi:hypothetical protein